MSETLMRVFALQRGYSQAALAAGREAEERRQRISHPRGRFDSAGRFFLDERCGCCTGIRAPSAEHPFSEMNHGRSLTHVAQLHGVPQLHVRRLAKAFRLARHRDAQSHHAKAQLLTQLDHILKNVPPDK